MEDILLKFGAMNLSEYDPLYFPPKREIKKITRVEWNSLYNVPSWVDFGYHRCFELQQADELNLNFKVKGVPGMISHVFKIINPYLERAYNLKKMQKSREGGVSEKIVYHATTPANVDSINVHNFNWRLFGQSRGSKHGRGVSFSPHPNFANMFCKSMFDKRIFEVRVLQQNSQVGFNHHILPDIGYDTTVSRNGNVLVKFEDSEFLPTHVIHYK